MSLALFLDANVRLILEPGYRHYYAAGSVGQTAQPADDLAAKQLWIDPQYGTVMLKPLQLQGDFLNHAAQLSSGAVLRLSTDFLANPADVVGGLIWEGFVGTTSNPWIFHAPCTTALGAPTLAPAGLNGSYTLQQAANQSETGSGTVFASPPGRGRPGVSPMVLTLLVDTNFRFRANTGFVFRWYMPPPSIPAHQTLYAFTFGQYALFCRGALVEVFEDVSPAGDRSAWQLRYKGLLLSPGATIPTGFNPNWPWGQGGLDGTPMGGAEFAVMVLPYRRHRVLVFAHPNQFFAVTTRARPRLLPDGSDWDITRSDSVQVHALTPEVGRFQVQKVKFEAGPVTINMDPLIIEYQGLTNPALLLQSDANRDSSLVTNLQFPKLYTFPASPLADDCPPPTTAGSAQSRTFGITMTFGASSDQETSPQYYGTDVFLDPVFQDNPNTALGIFDVNGASRVMSGELSLGSLPGDGRLTARVLDVPGLPITPYYFRSELPVQLQLDGVPLFTGYSDRIEVKPWRGDATPGNELSLRATDRWLLLEESFLRDQRDWTDVGHITVVDTIVRQCGIDTGSPPGMLAEYPAGWDGALASSYNTPLGTPVLTPDNLEGNQLLGWKPQPNDTGASFLKRIQDFYSGWLMGFRADGSFYYLPYNYFTANSVTFHSHAGRRVLTGLMPDAGASTGLALFVHAGTATVLGSVTAADQSITLPANQTSTIYLKNDGTLTSNTTGIPPASTLILGTATTGASTVASVDTSPASGRQIATSPTYRSPVEHRTIEPSGNVVQVVSQYMVDLTANKSGLFVEWQSILNPAAVNYLGRYKWQIVQIGGAFSCPQLNLMAYIVFQASRRRRKRVSFQATFVPTLKIGQVFTLEGIGQYRLLEMRVNLIRQGWEVADYVGESTEPGY